MTINKPVLLKVELTSLANAPAVFDAIKKNRNLDKQDIRYAGFGAPRPLPDSNILFVWSRHPDIGLSVVRNLKGVEKVTLPKAKEDTVRAVELVSARYATILQTLEQIIPSTGSWKHPPKFIACAPD